MVPVFDSYFSKLSKHLNKLRHYLLLSLTASVWLLIILNPYICHGNACNLFVPVALLGPSGLWLR